MKYPIAISDTGAVEPEKKPGVMFWVFLAAVGIYVVGETLGKKR